MGISSVKIIGINLIILLFCLSLSACSIQERTTLGEARSEWDFDHKLQFYKTQFDNNHYQLEVISSNSDSFYRMSAFLLRNSYLICGQYGYTLTIVKGVESVDQKYAMPNLIKSNLVATLQCPLSIKQD